MNASRFATRVDASRSCLGIRTTATTHAALHLDTNPMDAGTSRAERDVTLITLDRSDYSCIPVRMAGFELALPENPTQSVKQTRGLTA